MLSRTLALTLFASSLFAAEPEKLIKLRGSYESAITKATAPIQKTYTTELEKLKIEFTKSGNLEGALAVDAELKMLASRASAPQVTDPSDKAKRLRQLKTTDEFAQWLAGTKWEAESGAGLSFAQDGKSFGFVDATTKKEAGSYPLTFVKVGLLEFKWSSGPNGQIQFSDDLRSCGHGGKTYKKLP